MTAKNLTRRVVIAAPVAIAMLALGIFLLSGGGENTLHSPAGEPPPQPAAPGPPRSAVATWPCTMRSPGWWPPET